MDDVRSVTRFTILGTTITLSYKTKLLRIQYTPPFTPTVFCLFIYYSVHHYVRYFFLCRPVSSISGNLHPPQRSINRPTNPFRRVYTTMNSSLKLHHSLLRYTHVAPMPPFSPDPSPLPLVFRGFPTRQS